MKKELEETYDAKRFPAWCDRILWSSLAGCDVNQLSYTSAPSITSRYTLFIIESSTCNNVVSSMPTCNE